ncbi:MAG: hypothetical protein V1908_03625 [Candidatus Peregrinibacteria bacterium]
MRNIHFTNIIIKKSYEIVWGWLSEPSKYPLLYPNWVAKAVKMETNKYEITDQRNQKSLVTLSTDKEKGSIDLKIGNEISRTKLFAFDNNTAVVHIGTRWKQMRNPLFWFLYKRIVDKDFRNAKKVIEETPSNCIT